MDLFRWWFNVENDSTMAHLELTRKSFYGIPQYTELHRVGDGTIFFHYFHQYHSAEAKHRLYVNSGNSVVEATLPAKQIRNLIAHGNSLYFCAEDKIYSATYANVDIKIVFLRDKAEEEELCYNGLVTRRENAKKYVYRLFDDPKSDAILAKPTGFEHDDLLFDRMHRGRAIYHLLEESFLDRRPSVVASSESFIVIKIRGGGDIKYCKDSSPFIYLTAFINESEHVLYALDTRTMRVSPGLMIGHLCLSYILGIDKGVLTGMRFEDGHWRLAEGQLPAGYWEPEDHARESK